MYQLMKSVPADLRPVTPANAKSLPAAIIQGVSTIFADASKKGRHSGWEASPFVQRLLEGLCLERGHAHPLPVERIEAAYSVAHDEIATGKAGQALVLPTKVRWKLIGDRIGQRLSIS